MRVVVLECESSPCYSLSKKENAHSIEPTTWAPLQNGLVASGDRSFIRYRVFPRMLRGWRMQVYHSRTRLSRPTTDAARIF